jgi:hypothetical protein
MKNDPIEDELDTIRIELYEQTRDMLPEKRISYMRQLTAPVNKEFGITPIETYQINRN